MKKILGILVLLASPSFLVNAQWIDLLDKDLSQWDTYLSYRHQNTYDGSVPKDANQKVIQPIGYHKNIDNVFTVQEQQGELVLRISGEIYGCLFTRQEFENYHLKLQVKWGERKYEPRKDKLRDSGILYHSIGEAGVDYWRAWMLSQEFQIMEGHIGDYWSIANSAIDIRAYLSEGEMNSVADEHQSFLSFGRGSQSGFCLRGENHESAPGEWTSVELICFEDKSIYIVNGHVVMVLKNSRYVKDGKAIPLTKGKIQLQSEAAEVFYRDVQIKKLSALPKEWDDLFI